MDLKKTIYYLFGKVFGGEGSPDENLLVDAYLTHRMEHSEWDSNSMGHPDVIGQSLKKRIDKEIRGRYILRWSKYAAVLLVLISTGLWFFSNDIETEHMIVSTHSQMDSIALPDGSRVILSPYSELSFPKEFGDSIRPVLLAKGNAFFKVRPNPHRPFVVSAEGLETKVLGTSFNIQNSKSSVVVRVRTGKVQVGTPDDEMVSFLGPSDKITYDVSKNTFSKIQREEGVEWYADRITLKDLPMEQVAILISNRFGYALRFSDPAMGDQKVTLNIMKGDSIQNVVQQLNFITKKTYEIKNANEIEVTDNP